MLDQHEHHVETAPDVGDNPQTHPSSVVRSTADDIDNPDDEVVDNADELRGSTLDPDVSTNLPISPNEDVKAYGDLIRRIHDSTHN